MPVRNTLLTLTLMASLGLAPAAQAFTLDEAISKIDSMIAEMTQLKAQLLTLDTTGSVSVTTPTPTVQGAQSKDVLTMDLSYGATNEDIARIQRLLATDPDIYPYGVDSGFFGPKTQEAIRNFQSRFGLDTVGVIGPATTALLEVFLAAYPDENYPANVLSQSVPTGQTSNTDAADTAAQPDPTPTSVSNKYSSITIDEDEMEFLVRSRYVNGERHRDLLLYPEDEDELIEQIAEELDTTKREVTSLVDMDDWFDEDEGDREDAEDAVDRADDILDEVRDLIADARDDDEDVDEAEELYNDARDVLDDAEDAIDDEDYEEAEELAEEAEELGEDAEEAVGGRVTEEEAEEAIDDADDELDEVRDMIRDAEDDGDDVDDAEELYDRGRDKLDDAEEALEEGDYEEALEEAEEAEELADDAKDEL